MDLSEFAGIRRIRPGWNSGFVRPYSEVRDRQGVLNTQGPAMRQMPHHQNTDSARCRAAWTGTLSRTLRRTSRVRPTQQDVMRRMIASARLGLSG